MLYRYKATVVRVVDGDTIDVDIDLGFYTILHKQRVRLYGIDAPEVRGREKIAGLESKAWLMEAIQDQAIELVTFKDAKGKYGRWLGVVYMDDKNVNQQMVELGLAEVKYQ